MEIFIYVQQVRCLEFGILKVRQAVRAGFWAFVQNKVFRPIMEAQKVEPDSYVKSPR